MGYKGQNDLNGSFGDGDWAYHNAISNGGNKAHLWRTLTRDEWNYLFYQRKDALSKFAPATVNGVHGIVILPEVASMTGVRTLPVKVAEVVAWV